MVSPLTNTLCLTLLLLTQLTPLSLLLFTGWTVRLIKSLLDEEQSAVADEDFEDLNYTSSGR